MRIHKTKQHKLPVLWLYAKDGSVLYHDRLDAFPFPEAVVLSGCEKYFGDPNPCEIHRRALQVRLCAEIESILPANQKTVHGCAAVCYTAILPRIAAVCFEA